MADAQPLNMGFLSVLSSAGSSGKDAASDPSRAITTVFLAGIPGEGWSTPQAYPHGMHLLLTCHIQLIFFFWSYFDDFFQNSN